MFKSIKAVLEGRGFKPNFLIKLQAKATALNVTSILARLFLSGLKLANDSQYLFHIED